MNSTEKQEKDLKELVDKLLDKLTRKPLDAYTTASSVSLLAAQLISPRSLFYQPAKVPKILDELYKEGRADRIQIVVRQINPQHTRRKFFAYRFNETVRLDEKCRIILEKLYEKRERETSTSTCPAETLYEATKPTKYRELYGRLHNLEEAGLIENYPLLTRRPLCKITDFGREVVEMLKPEEV